MSVASAAPAAGRADPRQQLARARAALDRQAGQASQSASRPWQTAATGRAIKFQQWLTLMGTTGGLAEAIQPVSQWIDALAAKAFDFRVQVLGVTAATLTLESAPTVEGPFAACATYTAVTNTPLALSAEGGSNTFSRYIRWRVNGTGDWSICFQLRAKASACSRATGL